MHVFHLFIYSCNKYLPSTHYVTGDIMGSGVWKGRKQTKIPAPVQFLFYYEETGNIFKKWRKWKVLQENIRQERGKEVPGQRWSLAILVIPTRLQCGKAYPEGDL